MKFIKHKKMVIFVAVATLLAVARIVMLPFEERPPERAPVPVVTKQSESAIHKITDGVLHETFLMRDGLLGPQILIGVLVPLGGDGEPRPGSCQLIFYAPFTGEHSRVPGSQKWLRELARETGCTVFTMRIDSAGSDVPKHNYIYPESGWHETVFRAQKAVERKRGIPAGKLLLTGESSGGSMAQQLSETNPGKIVAAAWVGGSRYQEKIGDMNNFPRLILNTWQCPGEASSARHAEELRKRGVAALDLRTPPDFKVTKPEHHAPSETAYRFLITYLSGIAELMRVNNGILPPAEKWIDRKFPSERFAALWREFHAQAEHPKSVTILFVGENEPLLRDFTWLIRQAESLPVVVPLQEDLLQERRHCDRLLPELLKETSLPVNVIGIGSPAQPGIAAALQASSPRIKQIVMFDTPVNSPFEEIAIAVLLKDKETPVIHYGGGEAVSGVTCRPLSKRGNREYAEAVREVLK